MWTIENSAIRSLLFEFAELFLLAGGYTGCAEQGNDPSDFHFVTGLIVKGAANLWANGRFGRCALNRVGAGRVFVGTGRGFVLIV